MDRSHTRKLHPSRCQGVTLIHKPLERFARFVLAPCRGLRYAVSAKLPKGQWLLAKGFANGAFGARTLDNRTEHLKYGAPLHWLYFSPCQSRSVRLSRNKVYMTVSYEYKVACHKKHCFLEIWGITIYSRTIVWRLQGAGNLSIRSQHDIILLSDHGVRVLDWIRRQGQHRSAATQPGDLYNHHFDTTFSIIENNHLFPMSENTQNHKTRQQALWGNFSRKTWKIIKTPESTDTPWHLKVQITLRFLDPTWNNVSVNATNFAGI